MKKLLTFLSLLVTLQILVSSCNNDQTSVYDDELQKLIIDKSPTKNLSYYIFPDVNNLTSIPNQDPKNPITKAKIELGKLLFFETGIGIAPKKSMSMETYSCATCHLPEKNFTPGRFQGIADGAIGFGTSGEGRIKNEYYEGTEVDAQGARPLPTINLTYVRNALWNGSFGSFGMNTGTESIWGVADTLTKINNEGHDGLEAVIPRALTVHRQVINKEIVENLGYKKMFDDAFPDVAEYERYTFRTASDAIACYFRTIFTDQAPFQKYLKGDYSAMTDKQKRGAALFFGKAGCTNCHNSPSLNGQAFAAIGVKDLDQNGYVVFKTTDGRSNGRYSFTLNENDRFKFKVPQLYNLKNINFYFHGSSKTSIRDVVKYFNNGIPENPRVGSDRVSTFFHPLGMTSTQVEELADFIENGLYDENLMRYKPSSIMSGNCFPDNDTQSQIDMGCK